MYGHLQRLGEKTRHGCQHGGDVALHVSAATPVKLAIALGQLERVDRPVLAGHRHHVGVAGQHHAAPIIRADRGEQVGFGPFGVVIELARHPQCFEVPANEIDQRQVGLAADRGKTDQPGQQGAAGKITHRPAPRSLAQQSGRGRG
ncbi:hypothetical protein D9M73_211410 [compost metagenome]